MLHNYSEQALEVVVLFIVYDREGRREGYPIRN
jgi:hypothetical protein